MFANLEPIFVTNPTSTRRASAAPKPPSAEAVTAPTDMATVGARALGRARRHPSFSSSSSASSTSEKDIRDDDNVSEDQFHFSAGNTPSSEHAPIALGTSYSRPRDSLLLGKQLAAAISEPLKPTSSKPIAIEIPKNRRMSLDPESAPAITPPEPLSARGDIPGGYFPFHEDPKSRVRRPHPFHSDANKAKRRSQHRTAESTQPAPMVVSMPDPPKPLPMSTSHAPLSSYLPTGVHESAVLPLGKYYPSNWEKRQQQRMEARARTADGGGPSVPAKSESQVPKVRHGAGHARSNSEVKRRLLQYQRDMVAQATVAASALLSKASSSSDSSTAALSGIRLSESILKTYKPSSPRLAPLGSPGPVTPMSLESGGDGYHTEGKKSTGQKSIDAKPSPTVDKAAPISV